MIWFVTFPCHFEYISIVVSCYGPCILPFVLRNSILLCHVMVLTRDDIFCVPYFSCVMICSLHNPVFCEVFSFVGPCYGPYSLRYILSTYV